MTRLLNITRWPAAAVFVLAGSAAVSSAFAAINLFTYAMANVEFIRTNGWEAIRYGALWQAGELMVCGAVSFGFWMIFKISERELTRRYMAWALCDQGERSRR